MSQAIYIGLGVDAHPLKAGRKLVLGGLEIPHDKGLDGHSDGDVLTHALIDALLGAGEMGDIGSHFPSTDEQYKGVESTALLKKVLTQLGSKGLRPVQVDCVIIAEQPRLAPHYDAIKDSLKHILPGCRVSVKATTTDGMGFTGRGEGIAAQVVALVQNLHHES